MRYQAMRAVRDKSLHVICYEDKFELLPDEVRHRGPWQGLKRGNFEALKADYRQALANEGYDRCVRTGARQEDIRCGRYLTTI
jgi:hypothetical protein